MSAAHLASDGSEEGAGLTLLTNACRDSGGELFPQCSQSKFGFNGLSSVSA